MWGRWFGLRQSGTLKRNPVASDRSRSRRWSRECGCGVKSRSCEDITDGGACGGERGCVNDALPRE